MTSEAEVTNIFKMKAKLADLFPPDDPNSSWLLRLAVLRDDFTYEVNRTFETERTSTYEVKMMAVREDDPTGVWCRVYGLRKLAITIREVKNIFSHEVIQYLETVNWPADVVSVRAPAHRDRTKRRIVITRFGAS
jgi:hypothetical protein